MRREEEPIMARFKRFLKVLMRWHPCSKANLKAGNPVPLTLVIKNSLVLQYSLTKNCLFYCCSLFIKYKPHLDFIHLINYLPHPPTPPPLHHILSSIDRDFNTHFQDKSLDGSLF